MTQGWLYYHFVVDGHKYDVLIGTEGNSEESGKLVPGKFDNQTEGNLHYSDKEICT